MKHNQTRYWCAALCICGAMTACLPLCPASENENAKRPADKAAPGAETAKGSDPAKTSAKKPETPPATEHVVKRGPFKIEVELPGIFEASRMTPLRLAPKEWSDLTVIEAVAPGSLVAKGDTLVRLETRKLEKLIKDLEAAAPLAEVTLQLAEEELAAAQKSTPIDLAAARRREREVAQDLAYFEKTGRLERETSSRESVKRATHALEYAEEELNQLRKMYEADDLTEETEEIIMKRAKNDVDSSKYNLERTTISSERDLATNLPREHQRLRDQARGQEIAAAKAVKSLPQALKKRRLEVQKLRQDQMRAGERLKDLERDLEALTISAPHDGIVYYGSCNNGKWATAAAVEKKLVPGGKLTPRETFITVVRAKPLNVRATVPEDKLQHLKTGHAAVVSPVSAPERNLDAKIGEISLVPLPAGGFGSLFELENANTANIYPGMTCKIRALAYRADNALTIPKSAVRREGAESTVRLKGGKTRTVRTGKSDGKTVEILAGLKEGDVVLLR